MRKVFIVLLVAAFLIGTYALTDVSEDVSLQKTVDFSDIVPIDNHNVTDLSDGGDGGGTGGGSPIPG
jgi:hypothetical protein